MVLTQRPRRNRRSKGIRKMVRESKWTPGNLIYPLFLIEGKGSRVPVKSMPGVDRLSADLLIEEARAALKLGVPAVALFPALPDSKKDPLAKESTNPDGLLQTTVKRLKDALPELVVITDVAMDPYSSDGHDGLVKGGKIVNDPTLPILAEMAVSQAKAGADYVAPSDMMDGRVGYLRNALDEAGFEEVGILAYTAKYASAFYGPFRDALDSAPRHGDKKTYQMDPSNAREALREARLDVKEGADLVMVKPAGAYLDIIHRIKEEVDVPVAAYQVSGEYAMIQAAAQNGWLDLDGCMNESLTAIRRAGADVILTYFARRAAELFSND
ncbi:MAG TPA: porphobilinogen synthase [Bdellovibrionota bacterium]|jgi:porphobilinogen synthase|nr:porphobilinogen synthase [Bdellovibrionota bacterium]